MKPKFCYSKYSFLTVMAGFLSVVLALNMQARQYNFPVGNALPFYIKAPLQVAGLAKSIVPPNGSSLLTAPRNFTYAKTGTLNSVGAWQTLIPAAGAIIGREENAYVAAGDKFYLMGGRGIVPVQEYDPLNKTWVNKAKPPVELNHFQGVALNGLIYAAGAMNGRFPHEVPLSKVYVYNPAFDKWFAGSAIPVARKRGAAGAITYHNKIYIVGGITDGHWAGWVKWFDEYDPYTNTWKILPDAPRERDHFHAVVINDKLYLAGGRRSSTSTGQTFQLTVPEVDVYDFTKGTWSTLPPESNLPIPRAGAANVILDSEIVVIGGESGIQSAAHNETHALNVVTNTWRKLANLQQGRHGTGAIVSNKDIYIAAGPAKSGGTPLLTTQEDYFISSPTPPVGTPLSQSKLSAVPALSLGSLEVNSSTSKILTLTNSGSSQDILISSITISGAGSFSYSSPFPLPFAVAPGKSIDVTVQFKPINTGAQTAKLIIAHSGQTGSTSTSLSGTGIKMGTSQQVVSFTLINALSNQDIQTLDNGAIINLDNLGSNSLNIRANTSPATVGSVVFVLSGQETRTQTESTKPLALFGGSHGNYNKWTPSAGSYTLKATPYTKSSGTGTAGTSLTINFTVSDAGTGTSQAVTSFTLINAINGQDIQILNDGDVLNLTTLASTRLNIRANTSPATVGSVFFVLGGQEVRKQTESVKPIALFGDHNGTYNTWIPAVGSYILKATPYTKSGATGTAGTSLTITFTIVDDAITSVESVTAFTPKTHQ